MFDAINRELSHHQYLRERLEAEFPEANEETLRDTLDDRNLVATLKARIEDMQARAGRIDARAPKKRELVTSVIKRADLKKLKELDLTVSLRPTRALLAVVDEEAVPEEFWKPQPPKLDRQGQFSTLAAGRDTPGAILGNPHMTITVRTK